MGIEFGEYGPVKITKGKYKNRHGVYDDDEYGKCIVYLAEKFEKIDWVNGAKYVLVKKEDLEKRGIK